MAITKRTPCVGVCSTTYGDLVCRGCKRFAHEIVQWNGYDQQQQERIWERLRRLRDEVVSQHVKVEDYTLYSDTCRRVGCDMPASAEAVHEVMRALVAQHRDLQDAGLSAVNGAVGALEVMRAIDAEVYARSIAHYERSFKIPV